MRRGLVVGRFQPYHLGHHSGIMRTLRFFDEVVIVIGSPMKSFEIEKNPFTCGERIEMISGALKASRVFNRCHIVPVPDIQDNSLWVSRIESFCPKFDVVYTNNPLVAELFSVSGYSYRSFISGHKDIESKYVRAWIKRGIDIKDSVPKSVEEYLTKICAGGRFESLLEMEEKK